MSLILDKCIEHHDDRSIITVKENGKTYQLNNVSKQKVKKVKIDGCIQQAEGEKRCDYLLTINEKINRAIFIELKGGGLVTAIKQIRETITLLKDEIVSFKIDARIIGSNNVPNLTTTSEYQKLFRLIKHTEGEIKIATNKFFSENI